MRIDGNPDAFSVPSDDDYNAKAQPGEPCDDCGGTGKDLKVVEVTHGHHTNPRAKERWT
jgi:hypothetical protein